MPAYRTSIRTSQSPGPHGPSRPETVPPLPELPSLCYPQPRAPLPRHPPFLQETSPSPSAERCPTRLPSLRNIFPELRSLPGPSGGSITSYGRREDSEGYEFVGADFQDLGDAGSSESDLNYASGDDSTYAPPGPERASNQDRPRQYSPHIPPSCSLEHQPSLVLQRPFIQSCVKQPPLYHTDPVAGPSTTGGIIEQEPPRNAWYSDEPLAQPRRHISTPEYYSGHFQRFGSGQHANSTRHFSRCDPELRKSGRKNRHFRPYTLTPRQMSKLPWDHLVRFAKSRGVVSRDIIVGRLCRMYGDEIPISPDDHITLSVFEDHNTEVDQHAPTLSPRLQRESNGVVPEQEEAPGDLATLEREDAVREGESHDLEGSHAARQAARVSSRRDRKRLSAGSSRNERTNAGKRSPRGYRRRSSRSIDGDSSDSERRTRNAGDRDEDEDEDSRRRLSWYQKGKERAHQGQTRPQDPQVSSDQAHVFLRERRGDGRGSRLSMPAMY